jgi:hypothetical protein
MTLNKPSYTAGVLFLWVMELSFYPKWKYLLIKILPVPRTGIEEIVRRNPASIKMGDQDGLMGRSSKSFRIFRHYHDSKTIVGYPWMTLTLPLAPR